ncbi:MAG: GNAT family N-acetyltransferase [Dehalococcoidia bacterium]|nr:GNAT family N-acetyltransferase [Dehalococcoidia bacterium]
MSASVHMWPFPKEAKLSDGTLVTLRLMVPGDEAAVLAFFRAVPADDRYYLKDDVTSLEVVRGWAKAIDYNRVLPLLAVKDGQVIGDGSLHFWQGARRHQAEVRISVVPEYRSRGLGRAMMRELIRIARERGLRRLLMEVVPAREEAAVRVTGMLGFTPMVVLPDYAIDRSGLLALDLIVMALDLEEAHNY